MSSNFKMHLTANELAILDGILRPLNAPGHEDRTFADAMRRWIEFVQEVESGYELNIYEYTNDLWMRDLIQEVADACPSSFSSKLVDFIAAWDQRFIASTRAISQPLLASRKGRVWWTRVPRTLKPELRSDLESDGIV